MSKFSIGDSVLVKDRDFTGTIIATKENFFVVEDQDGDCWDEPADNLAIDKSNS